MLKKKWTRGGVGLKEGLDQQMKIRLMLMGRGWGRWAAQLIKSQMVDYVRIGLARFRVTVYEILDLNK